MRGPGQAGWRSEREKAPFTCQRDTRSHCITHVVAALLRQLLVRSFPQLQPNFSTPADLGSICVRNTESVAAGWVARGAQDGEERFLVAKGDWKSHQGK